MKKLFVLLSVFVWSTTIAQEWTKTSVPKDLSLKVGDRVPLTVLHNMINYKEKTLPLPDPKAKLTILDFWGTTCGPCVAAWPKLLDMQKEFGRDLQIILVNKYEDEQRNRDFIARRKRIFGVDMILPVSCRDTNTWKYFPPTDIPRYVWIDSKGTVQSITKGNELNRDNVKKWITSGPFQMKQAIQKKVFVVTKNEPIFVNGNGGVHASNAFHWSSSLTSGQDDVSAESDIFYDSIQGYGITLTGSSLLHLYGTAYNNRLRPDDYFDFLPLGRMEVIANDTAKYHSKDFVRGGASYNYQLISGKRSREQLLEMMRQDLDRYFNLDVKWEKRQKRCLVFSMFDSTLVKRKVIGEDPYIRDMGILLDRLTMRNVITLMELGTQYRLKYYPIVDETQYKGLLTGIVEEGNGLDPVSLDKMLSKYGLHLKVEMREIDVLVLRERSATP